MFKMIHMPNIKYLIFNTSYEIKGDPDFMTIKNY